MNKIRIFLGAACLVVAFAAAAATKVTTVAVPYYFIESGVCTLTEINPTDCVTGSTGCVKFVPEANGGAGANRQIFDTKNATTEACQQPLRLVTP